MLRKLLKTKTGRTISKVLAATGIIGGTEVAIGNNDPVPGTLEEAIIQALTAIIMLLSIVFDWGKKGKGNRKVSK